MQRKRCNQKFFFLFCMFKKIFCFVFFILIVSRSVSLVKEKKSLTLDEAIQLGLETSKSLRSSQMNILFAEAKSEEMLSLDLPTVKFSGAYTRLSDVPPFKANIPANAFAPGFPANNISFPLSPIVLDNYNTRLTIQQPIFSGFKIESSKAIAEYNVHASQSEFLKEKREAIFNIKNAYWTLFKLREVKKLLDENVEQMKAHLADVENFKKQGMATTNDVLKVQVQLSNVQLSQLDAASAVQLATMTLNNFIGLPLHTEIMLTTNVPREEQKFASLDELIATAIQLRPEISAMEYRIKASDANITLAKSGWFPQVAFVGNYTYARPNQRIVPTTNTFHDTWDVNVSISFDVWNWNTTSLQTTQAQAQRSQAETALSLLKDGITLEVTQQYLSLHQSLEKISVAEKTMMHAEENFRVTNEKFKNGIALNSELLDAEVAVLQAKTTYTQSLIEYELSQARLEKIIGK